MISGLMDFSQYGVLTGEPLPPDLIRDMIACAHNEGFSVMAHANGDEAVRAALAGGVDSHRARRRISRMKRFVNWQSLALSGCRRS